MCCLSLHCKNLLVSLRMAKFKYDVYVEGDCVDDLVLIKFPAMRSQFENPADEIQLSIKPKSMKLKLETASKNYYTSTKTPIEDGQLFACKFVNDRLVCRPATNLITFRSDFTHLDVKEEVDPKEEIRPVSVKFAGPDKQSFVSRNTENQQDSEEALEEYQPIRFKTLTSREALVQRATLFGQQMAKVKPDPDANSIDEKPIFPFILDIKPKIEKLDVDQIYSNDAKLAQSSTSKESSEIKHIVKECLLKAKIVSFEELHQFIRSHDNFRNVVQLSNKDVLDALSELALLVQGNWAIKSEILYGDSSQRECTDVTGIPINLFIAARDYLLWMFTQDRLVSRLEYSKVVRMPDHDILELSNQLATFRKDIKRWEIKLPTDDRFLEQFPDIVQRQATFWKVRRANKLSMFNA